MSRTGTQQVLVITGAIVLFVLLIFADTSLPVKKQEESSAARETPIDIQEIVNQEVEKLDIAQKSSWISLKTVLESTKGEQKISLLDSVTNWWMNAQKPVIAGWYAKQKAVLTSKAEHWKKAGNHFYMGTRFADNHLKKIFCGQAIECYSQSLALDSNDVEVKINLASCYVEGSDDPMKGISLLKEVEKADSNNVNLQLSFAFFSVKSQQFDKAIARFNKVLQLNPGFIEAYLHLADIYETKGDRGQAVSCLEKYISLETDITVKTEVQNYINKLKNT